MLLEKSENLFELSAKQLVIQSRLASSIFPGQAMFGVWKPNVNIVYSKVRYIRIQQKLFKCKYNLILFKSNNKPKSLSKRVVQVISYQLFHEIRINKWKYCLLASILFREMPWFKMTSQRSKFQLAYKNYLRYLRWPC